MKSFIHKYLPELVYGSIDGIVTTFAIVAGAAGAQFSPAVVLVLGVSNVFADGFSMASSNYLSVKSEIERDNNAETMHTPMASAVATFGSFIAIGLIPILPYIYGFVFSDIESNLFLWSVVATFVAFIFVGFMRGTVSHRKNIYTIGETLLLGIVAAIIAYGVGALIHSWIGFGV
jgi:VIT1/CCC1 family predicted Fe2+/Mn2+ transporter